MKSRVMCDIELEAMPDHVHTLCEVDPQFGIHRFVKRIKGQSSRLLRQELDWLNSRPLTLWTNSYFVAILGGVPFATIQQYIENQKNVLLWQSEPFSTDFVQPKHKNKSCKCSWMCRVMSTTWH
jgi:hypothetical protein